MSFTGYKVNITLVNTHYFPYDTEFTEQSRSQIWLHDLKGTEVKPKFDRPFEPVRASQPVNCVQGILF